MVTTMLAMALLAHGPAAAAAADLHALPRPTPPIASLPIAATAAWPMRRCGDTPGNDDETTALAAIEAACTRLTLRDRASYRPGHGRWTGGSSTGGDGKGDDSRGWRVARAMLPGLEGLQGLVGAGGLGLAVGSELQLVRGAHMTLHLAAARDTRIATTMFAPDATVHARCGACWDESEALLALNGGRRVAFGAPAR